MIRTVIGGLLGGVAIFLIGFIFWGTPLSKLALSTVDAQSGANVQAALAEGLTAHGTGVYQIPSPGTSEGTTLYGKGPVALVQFNTSGFPVEDSGAMIGGLVLALATGLLIAFGLWATAGTLTSFAARARVVVLFSAAAVLWLQIGQPVFNHAPWGYYIYLAFSDFVALVAAGLIVARWFMVRDEVVIH